MYKFANNSFYYYGMQEEYLAANNWPEGGVDVSDEVFAEFLNPEYGTKLGTDADGNPTWIDDDSIEEMEKSVLANRRDRLMDTATGKISPLQDAVDLEIATDDEIYQLKAWKKYRVELMRTDITSEEIIWPEIPS
ncbi:tail fiber assembly protein [Lonsdalea quercina]|uniref:tail fiber assembly protein n=1 Tax=Lonsdalea quercina TaxID=71657 RepID=UPI00397517BE